MTALRHKTGIGQGYYLTQFWQTERFRSGSVVWLSFRPCPAWVTAGVNKVSEQIPLRQCLQILAVEKFSDHVCRELKINWNSYGSSALLFSSLYFAGGREGEGIWLTSSYEYWFKFLTNLHFTCIANPQKPRDFPMGWCQIYKNEGFQ